MMAPDGSRLIVALGDEIDKADRANQNGCVVNDPSPAGSCDLLGRDVRA